MLIIVFIIAASLTTIYQGFALSVLWSWFVVPSLHAPPIGVAAACGLTVVVVMLNGSSVDTVGKDFEDIMVESISRGIGIPTVYLLIGWIIHFFV